MTRRLSPWAARRGVAARVLAAGGVAVCMVAACGPGGGPAAERVSRAARGRGDVVIAVAWPWSTRRDILYGEGIQLAVDESNGEGGVGGRPIRIVRVDDHESVEEGRLVAQRLASDPDVVAVIGHLESDVSVPAAAIYDLAGLVMIAPTATAPELTAHGYRRVFRTTFTDHTVGRQMAEFAVAQKYKRVAIYYIRNGYGRGLANAFEERASELGVTIAARQSYDASGNVTAQAFEPTFREWKTLDLDAIFVAGEVPSAAQLIAAARADHVTVPILGGDALGAPALLSIAGVAAEGTIVASPFHADEPRAAVRHFRDAFTQRYHKPPDAGSALAYDAVRLLVYGMQQAHSTVPDRVATALHTVRPWDGVTGTFAFDSAGDLVGRTVLKMVVQHGRFSILPDQALALRAEPSPPAARGAAP